jgi:hypothetical protein
MPKKKLTPKELKRRVRNERYKEKARKLRATNAFGDLFKASGGVDLRSPERWSPAVKARVTRYAKELGPLIAGPSKTKRYFREDHLQQAIDASPQTVKLKGQKAAIFPVDDIDDEIEIAFTKDHQIERVVKGGIQEQKIYFDFDAFVRDPEAELERVMEDAPGRFFKFVTGETQSKDTYNRDEMFEVLGRYIERYDPTEKPLGEFLYGIKAFPRIRAAKTMQKRDARHIKEVEKRQKARLARRAQERRALSKAEKMTMRKGRVR